MGTKLLQERQEVGSVSSVDGIAACTLLIGIFPATTQGKHPLRHGEKVDVLKVQAIQIVLLHKVRHGLNESSAVICSSDSSGEILGSGPTTDGKYGFRVL